MLEAKADLWTYPADARVITTNLTVKSNGDAVMGKGCAKEAALKYPVLPKLYGKLLLDGLAKVYIVDWFSAIPPIDNLILFPVKNSWRDKADLALIERSTSQLYSLVDEQKVLNSVVLPRVGCGAGERDWETEVKPILEKYLDDRFTVVDFPDHYISPNR